MENSKFNSWYTQILEAVNTQEPVATTTETEVETKLGSSGPEVDSITPSFSREEIINDIDTIMTHLSQLGTQVKEELESIDDSVINEAGTETAMDKVKDFLFAPKYRSMQAKVNKMKMNALDIKLTADNLSGKADSPEKAKKDMLITKKATLDTQIDNLQKAVDSKAQERGSYVQKVLSTEKIKGQMDLVKRASGQEDDPAKKKSLADSAKELAQRYKEEQEAVKDLKDKAEPTPEEKAEAEKLKADKAAKAKEDEEAATKAKEDAIAADKKAEDDKAKTDKEEPNKSSELEANIKSYNDNIAAERQSLEKAKEELKSENDPEKIAKLKDSIQKSKEDIQEMQNEIKKLKDEVKKSSAKESLFIAATELGLNEMAAEIESKLDWQFENNSALARKYEVEIAKAKANKLLNESKFSTSVADRMRILLG